MSRKKGENKAVEAKPKVKKEIGGPSASLALSKFFAFLVRFDDFILGISYAILGITLLNTANIILVPAEYRIYIDWILMGVLIFLGFIITGGILVRGIKVEFRTTVLFLLLVDGSLATIGYRYDVLFGLPEIKSIMVSAATILLIASIALVLSIARQVSTVSRLAKESQEFLKAQQEIFQSIEKSSASEAVKKSFVKAYYNTQSFMSLFFSSVAEPLGEEEINKQMLVALFIAIVSALIQYAISPYVATSYTTAIGYEIFILFIALLLAWFWTNRKLKQLKAFGSQLELAKKVAKSL